MSHFFLAIGHLFTCQNLLIKQIAFLIFVFFILHKVLFPYSLIDNDIIFFKCCCWSFDAIRVLLLL